jgi:hypothetical protein
MEECLERITAEDHRFNATEFAGRLRREIDEVKATSLNATTRYEGQKTFTSMAIAIWDALDSLGLAYATEVRLPLCRGPNRHGRRFSPVPLAWDMCVPSLRLFIESDEGHHFGFKPAHDEDAIRDRVKNEFAYGAGVNLLRISMPKKGRGPEELKLIITQMQRLIETHPTGNVVFHGDEYATTAYREFSARLPSATFPRVIAADNRELERLRLVEQQRLWIERSHDIIGEPGTSEDDIDVKLQQHSKLPPHTRQIIIRFVRNEAPIAIATTTWRHIAGKFLWNPQVGIKLTTTIGDAIRLEFHVHNDFDDRLCQVLKFGVRRQWWKSVPPFVAPPGSTIIDIMPTYLARVLANVLSASSFAGVTGAEQALVVRLLRNVWFRAKPGTDEHKDPRQTRKRKVATLSSSASPTYLYLTGDFVPYGDAFSDIGYLVRGRDPFQDTRRMWKCGMDDSVAKYLAMWTLVLPESWTTIE